MIETANNSPASRRGRPSIVGVAVAALFPCLGPAAASAPALNPMLLPAQYEAAPWVSVHRDSSNSDRAPFATTGKVKVLWSALDGAALINPGSINDRGVLFVTSARGRTFSNLHAIGPDGKILWEAPPQRDRDGLDAFAGFNAPVLDRDGDVYIGDSNQLWAFHPDGRRKWVARLPEGSGSFVYQVISRQGYVGGITTEGWVLFFDRTSGSPAVKPFRLPQGEAPATGPHLPGLWQGGLVDHDAGKLFEKIAFGFGVQVANAPAVHPTTGRIFITAAGPKEGDRYSGRLYGLDIVDGEVKIGFSTRMDGGSGTSPSISPDGRYVYCAGEDGVILAIDADSGAVRWSAQGEGLLSPSLAADGTILTGNIFGDPTVIALNPRDGSQLWARDYSDYARTRLPELAPEPSLAASGKPVMRLMSVISLSSNLVWAGFSLGYEFRPAGSAKPLISPHKSVVCALSIATGELQHCTDVRDTLEGIISIGAGGRLYASHTSIFSSTAYFGYRSLLPARFRVPSRPVGGLTALGPVAPCDQLGIEADAIRRGHARAIDALKAGDDRGARVAIDQVRAQLLIARQSVERLPGAADGAYTAALDTSLAALGDGGPLSVEAIRSLDADLPDPSCRPVAERP